jgi:hypothetical protein
MQFRISRTSNLRSTLPTTVTVLALLAGPAAGIAQPVASHAAVSNSAVVAKSPFTVSVFAQSVPGAYTQPDSITHSDTAIYIGYGNGNAPDGSDGKSSTIVEYSFDGSVRKTILVQGHNDGLKVNPTTHELWTMQNEDGHAKLVVFNPTTWARTVYLIGTGPHGGGYDDMTFIGNKAYISASAPTHNPNTAPAIAEITLQGGRAYLKPVLMANSTAVDIRSGNTVTLNLQDPDSMTLNPGGDIVLDSQSDGELVVVSRPGGADQDVYRVLLTANGKPTTVDDTIFPHTSSGTLLVSDRDGETVYAITKPFLQPGSGYSASDSGGFIGELNFDTGVLTPVVTGMVSPHGMNFIPGQ